MIGEYILMAFLMNAGLVETATFGKKKFSVCQAVDR